MAGDAMLDYLLQHWLAIALPIIGLALIWPRRWRLIGVACLLAGVGAWTLPKDAGLWVLLSGGGMLAVMLAVVVVSGAWSPWSAYVAAAALVLGLGAWGMDAATAALNETVRFLLSVGVDKPNRWWLLGLLLVPAMVWISYGRLAGLGPVRSRLALG